MTLKTSLFNKGIYKSTIKRFYLGSIAYFLLLFITSCMVMLLTLSPNQLQPHYEAQTPYILNSGILIVSCIISTAVPTFMALLSYSFVHSRKNAIFTHSLPCGRNANYISSLLAAFTLMILPIVLNTLALLAMYFAGYCAFFNISSCFIYMGVNVLTVFVLFSYSSLCAMLTGNRFAFVALNVFIHFFIPLIVACFGMFSECFLYGYASDNVILDFVSKNNPVIWLNEIASTLTYKAPTIDISKIVWNIVVAFALYFVSLLLYKKRAIETAEDVAAYKCLYPILKYLITFIGALTAFAIFSDMRIENPLWVIVPVAIVSFVLYFALEMVLRKALKVWKRSYKGFVGFTIFMAIIFVTFSQTSFFGFENYLPKKDNIASASIYNYYHQAESPKTEDKKLIEYILSVHDEFTRKIPEKTFMQNDTDSYTRLHIGYTLENGRTIDRVYGVSNDEIHKIMSVAYKNDAYKMECERIFDENLGEIFDMYLEYNRDARIKEEHRKEIFSCIKKDILDMSYDQLYTDNDNWHFSINIAYNLKKTPENNSNKTDEFAVMITTNYHNTIKYLKENGYMDWLPINLGADKSYYLCKKADYEKLAETVYNPEYKTRSSVDKYVAIPQDAIKINNEKLSLVKEFIYTYKPCYIYENGGYLLLSVLKDNLHTPISAIHVDEAQRLIDMLK